MFDEISEEGMCYTPFGAKKANGEWIGGYYETRFLEDNFGQYSTAKEMIDVANSEGLKLFFEWLSEQGVLN